MIDETATADAFAVAPYTPSEIRFHLHRRHAHNGTVTACAVSSGLVRQPDWKGLRLPWPLGAPRDPSPASTWRTSFSGLLHWAFDTWFDENITFLRRMVLQVREHHVYPQPHLSHQLPPRRPAHTVVDLADPDRSPRPLVATLAGAGPAGHFRGFLASVIFSVLLVSMLEFHKCGHRARNPLVDSRLLQRSGLLLSCAAHQRPASLGQFTTTTNCIINGWADRTLGGRLGLFRGLEGMIARWTGAPSASANDHELASPPSGAKSFGPHPVAAGGTPAGSMSRLSQVTGREVARGRPRTWRRSPPF